MLEERWKIWMHQHQRHHQYQHNHQHHLSPTLSRSLSFNLNRLPLRQHYALQSHVCVSWNMRYIRSSSR